MRNLLMLLLFLVLVAAVAALSGYVTSSAVATWYAQLHKPAWTPPDSVFPPVWAVLYILMALAAWLIWRRQDSDTVTLLPSLWLLQLGLNLAWSLIFFGLRQPGLAMVEIILLWSAVLATTFLFYQAHRLAGLLMVPYLLWVTFAAVLNVGIWAMN
jgi:tryptophan-rich sensory protein